MNYTKFQENFELIEYKRLGDLRKELVRRLKLTLEETAGGDRK